jgi:hypothetical protein
MAQADAQALATRKGWSEACAEGYIDGQRYRDRGERPPGRALFGIGEYSLGFRAGYLGVPLMDCAELYRQPDPSPAAPRTGADRRHPAVATPTGLPHDRRSGGH